jgi:hypothetical protein
MATETVSHSTRRKLSPPAYARQLGVDTAKVLKWIRTGELPAFNAATTIGCKPRYLIDVGDIATFEARRAVQPPAPTSRRRRRDPEIIEFFK